MTTDTNKDEVLTINGPEYTRLAEIVSSLDISQFNGDQTEYSFTVAHIFSAFVYGETEVFCAFTFSDTTFINLYDTDKRISQIVAGALKEVDHIGKSNGTETVERLELGDQVKEKE